MIVQTIQRLSWIRSGRLTHEQLETHEYEHRTVSTDALVLKHQGIETASLEWLLHSQKYCIIVNIVRKWSYLKTHNTCLTVKLLRSCIQRHMWCQWCNLEGTQEGTHIHNAVQIGIYFYMRLSKTAIVEYMYIYIYIYIHFDHTKGTRSSL